ncbi:MAG: hypothetical protein CVU41_02150 [Chloroflexi bacterium HGW-Chloroflexi-3]|nr:MAG: hypothetical protein CVU41_02150 [Chloroflexi bacterium HGW-Chloroflexi-3]
MKVVLLTINESIRNLLNPDSIINNFPQVDSFYFSIPTNSSIPDQNHLIKQGLLFFQSQFTIDIGSYISVENKRAIRKNLIFFKEFSWEIFFHFNKWIKVCDGIFDEDLDWFISGFTGKIIDFYSNVESSVFMIAFSGNSLSKIPLEHLKSNINNNIPPFYTFLEPDLIMPDLEPENVNVDEKQRIDLMLKLTDFQDLSTVEKFKNFSDILNFWVDLFKEKTVIPIEVRIDSSDRSIYQLIDIPYFDERFGVWCTLLSDKKYLDIPMTKILEITNNKIFNNLLMNYQKMMSLTLPN